MKAEQRTIYLVLTEEINWMLCSFCKFAQAGFECGMAECHHPLEVISGDMMVEEPGADCWAFRPNLPVPDIADIVGIILAEGWVVASYNLPNEAGLIEVRGAKEWF